jgi:ankyrin repeat protein
LFNQYDLAKLLIHNNANINLQNKIGESALLIATKEGYINIVKLLIENDANLDLKDSEGLSALFYAISTKNNELIWSEK